MATGTADGASGGTPGADAPVIAGTIQIDVISDVVCPWCFVGKRRLEQALARLPHVHAEIFWRPFQLDGTIPKGGIPREEYLTRKFGHDRATDMYARLEKVGEEVGIPFAFDKIRISPNTLDAHRLLRWAQTSGEQSAVKEELFELFFLQGADIGDHDVLADVAARHNIERDVALRLLGGDADVTEVQAEIAQAQTMGVQGVPFFIFANSLAVSGAQPPEVLIEGIRQGIAHAAHDAPQPG